MIVCDELYFLAKLLRETLCYRCKGLALVRSVLYLSKMRAENYLSTVCDQLLDGRECCYDTGLICDNAILKRNIKVASYKDMLALCIDVIHCFFIKHWNFLLIIKRGPVLIDRTSIQVLLKTELCKLCEVLNCTNHLA